MKCNSYLLPYKNPKIYSTALKGKHLSRGGGVLIPCELRQRLNVIVCDRFVLSKQFFTVCHVKGKNCTAKLTFLSSHLSL